MCGVAGGGLGGQSEQQHSTGRPGLELHTLHRKGSSGALNFVYFCLPPSLISLRKFNRKKSCFSTLTVDFKVSMIFQFHHFQTSPRDIAKLTLLPHRVLAVEVNFSPRTQQRRVEKEATAVPHWAPGSPWAVTGHHASDGLSV